MYHGSLGEVSNREDWLATIAVIDDDGDDVDVTGATIVVAVRSQMAKSGDTPDLTASTDNGDVTISTSEFTFTFGVDDMRGLDPGIYDVACTILLNSITTQLFIGTIAVLDGIVS